MIFVGRWSLLYPYHSIRKSVVKQKMRKPKNFFEKAVAFYKKYGMIKTDY
jgi:hypothetical protein